MAKQIDQNSPEQDLKHLEARMDELIAMVDRLSQENQMLRSHQEEMAGERAKLIEKNELARNRVESMISRLKGMELGV